MGFTGRRHDLNNTVVSVFAVDLRLQLMVIVVADVVANNIEEVSVLSHFDKPCNSKSRFFMG